MIKQDSFFESLFQCLPLTAMVIDDDRKVITVNNTLINSLNIDLSQELVRCGNILGCIHAALPEGCGYTSDCGECMPRQVAARAIAGQVIQREKGSILVKRGEDVQILRLLISASPLPAKEQKLAVVVIEDVSNVTQVQGLLAVCASCKKVRLSDNTWETLETFIEANSEAEFTHDCCPSCMKALYSR